jgi:hypothetical protein
MQLMGSTTDCACVAVPYQHAVALTAVKDGLEAVNTWTGYCAGHPLTAAARAAFWIKRPGRKNAPQGPNQRIE